MQQQQFNSWRRQEPKQQPNLQFIQRQLGAVQEETKKQEEEEEKGHLNWKRKEKAQKKGGWSHKSTSSKPESIYSADQLPINQISVEVQKLAMPHYDKNFGSNHTDISHKEVLVILKKTLQKFDRKADDFYRDKNSKRNSLENNSQKPVEPNFQSFWNQRYYLFSKFDHGIKLKEEQWRSTIPEAIAKNIALRVTDLLEEESQVLDPFPDAGMSSIKFAKNCQGVFIPKVEEEEAIGTIKNNLQIYGVQHKATFLETSFFELTPEFLDPIQVDAVFLNPKWGTKAYNKKVHEFSLSDLEVDLRQALKQAFLYSSNVMLYLPNNTNLQELIQELGYFSLEMNKGKKQLVVEIQQYVHGNKNKGILVCTGKLARVSPHEIVEYFVQHFCEQQRKEQSINYLKKILENIFISRGFGPYINYFQADELKKQNLQKVIKKIQASFSQDEWKGVLKLHKTSKKGSSSRKSTNNSIDFSSKISTGEEDKSETHSQLSASGYNRPRTKSNIFSQKETINEATEMDELEIDLFMSKSPEEQAELKAKYREKGHLELKDLAQEDLEALTEAKNSDKRFDWWTHHTQARNLQDSQDDQDVQDLFQYLFVEEKSFANSD